MKSGQVRFVTLEADSIEKAEWKHQMYVAGYHVGDGLVFTMRNDDVGDYSTALDAVNALICDMSGDIFDVSTSIIENGIFGARAHHRCFEGQ